NGAGKTTTLRLALGLTHPDRGSVKIHGRSYHDLPAPMHEVGAVLDVKAYHPGRRARDHLVALAEAGGVSKKRVGAMLDLVGLSEVARRRVGTYSLGMTQRLGIAAALLGDPPVLLFDEPVNGLDPEGIVWVRNLMQALAAEGRTIFVSSHLMSEMSLTALHVVVIGKGRLITHSSVEELIKASSGKVVRLVSPKADLVLPRLVSAGAAVHADGNGLVVNGLDAAVVGDIAFAAGAPVHELTPQEASLEEAFMELTREEAEFHAQSDRGSAQQTPPAGEARLVAAYKENRQ
ncbi:MAG TPA: ATP-binding cassette domain-containing protein, partial [Acidimicrobiales bacterium]|nr:ATP-binding cassette domain-containing protein [Acidimicrobiales bacterium]